MNAALWEVVRLLLLAYHLYSCVLITHTFFEKCRVIQELCCGTHSMLLNEKLFTSNKLLLYFYLNNSIITSNITDYLACFLD